MSKYIIYQNMQRVLADCAYIKVSWTSPKDKFAVNGRHRRLVTRRYRWIPVQGISNGQQRLYPAGNFYMDA